LENTCFIPLFFFLYSFFSTLLRGLSPPSSFSPPLFSPPPFFFRCGAETRFIKSAGGDNPEERCWYRFPPLPPSEPVRLHIVRKRDARSLLCGDTTAEAPFFHLFFPSHSTKGSFGRDSIEGPMGKISLSFSFSFSPLFPPPFTSEGRFFDTIQYKVATRPSHSFFFLFPLIFPRLQERRTEGADSLQVSLFLLPPFSFFFSIG